MAETNISHRYARSSLVSGYDQQVFSKLTVMIAGAGALGNWIGLALPGFGVKKIIIADNDTVDLSNLNRQLAFTNADINNNKADALKKRIDERCDLDDSEVIAYDMELRPDTMNVFDDDQIDAVFLCLDNAETRLDVNAYCVGRKIPMIYGGTSKGIEGMVGMIIPGMTPCVRCFLEPTKDKARCSVEKEPSIVGTSMLISSMMLVQFQDFFMGKPTIPPMLKYIDGRSRPGEGIEMDEEGNVSGDAEGIARPAEPFFHSPYPRNPDCPVCSST